MKRLTVQLTMAILLTMSGIVLLFCGFWIDPQGKVVATGLRGEELDKTLSELLK